MRSSCEDQVSFSAENEDLRGSGFPISYVSKYVPNIWFYPGTYVGYISGVFFVY